MYLLLAACVFWWLIFRFNLSFEVIFGYAAFVEWRLCSHFENF